MLNLGALLLIFVGYWYLTRPKEIKSGNLIFSNVSILPDGIYEVLFSANSFRMVTVARTDNPGTKQDVYMVNDDHRLYDSNGLLMEHFIKKGKQIS